MQAAARLLDTATFDEISVAEITRAAGVNIGSFYARFPDKNALLNALYGDYLSRVEEALEVLEAGNAERTLRERIDLLVDLIARFFRDNRGLVKSAVLHFRTKTAAADREFPERISRIYRRGAQFLAADREAIALRAAFAVQTIVFACREIILFDGGAVFLDAPVDDRRLAIELQGMLLPYLQAEAGAQTPASVSKAAAS
ncbi:MAG: TetR/AcrR family transcriptional regulator [Caulobacterales bacterium]